MRSLLRRVVLLTLSLLAVMTLVAPAAHANHRSFDSFDGRFDRCGFFAPAFVIPTSTGNIVVLRDACGSERERFEPFRRRSFFDDGYNHFNDDGPNYTVIFNNF